MAHYTLPENIRREEAKKIDKIDREIIRKKIAITKEEPLVDQYGNKKYFLSQKIPLMTPNGQVIGILGISIDITHQKEYEKKLVVAKKQAESANKAKTEFLYNMRHDIRTPFSGILSLAQQMASEEQDCKKQLNLQEMAKSAETLLLYLNEILEFTQIDSGKIPIIYKSFNLNELLENCISTFNPSAKQKNIKLNLISNISYFFICDRFRLQRILINLMSNAIKFTHNGNISLFCNVVKRQGRNAIIELIVEDTGIGIPTEKQAIIFEKFRKIGNSYNSHSSGMGLGLRAVKELIDDLDGDINVESEINKGSRFICHIPMKIPLTETFDFNYQHNISHAITNSIKPKTKNTQLNTLLIEDSKIAQIAAKNILESINANVDICDTGIDAIEQYQLNEYDLILLDLGLPDINGYRVAKEIREIEEKNNRSRIPILVVTAHADEKLVKQYAHCIDSTILKPITREVLLNYLDKQVSNTREK